MGIYCILQVDLCSHYSTTSRIRLSGAETIQINVTQKDYLPVADSLFLLPFAGCCLLLLPAPQPVHNLKHFFDIHRLGQMFIHSGVLCHGNVFFKCVG